MGISEARLVLWGAAVSANLDLGGPGPLLDSPSGRA